MTANTDRQEPLLAIAEKMDALLGTQNARAALSHLPGWRDTLRELATPPPCGGEADDAHAAALGAYSERAIYSEGGRVLNHTSALKAAVSAALASTPGVPVERVRECAFEVFQDGAFCAAAEGLQPEAAREALHYGLMYGQDEGMGPITYMRVIRTPITAEALDALAQEGTSNG